MKYNLNIREQIFTMNSEEIDTLLLLEKAANKKGYSDMIFVPEHVVFSLQNKISLDGYNKVSLIKKTREGVQLTRCGEEILDMFYPAI